MWARVGPPPRASMRSSPRPSRWTQRSLDSRFADLDVYRDLLPFYGDGRNCTGLIGTPVLPGESTNDSATTR